MILCASCCAPLPTRVALHCQHVLRSSANTCCAPLPTRVALLCQHVLRSSANTCCAPLPACVALLCQHVLRSSAKTCCAPLRRLLQSRELPVNMLGNDYCKLVVGTSNIVKMNAQFSQIKTRVYSIYSCLCKSVFVVIISEEKVLYLMTYN